LHFSKRKAEIYILNHQAFLEAQQVFAQSTVMDHSSFHTSTYFWNEVNVKLSIDHMLLVSSEITCYKQQAFTFSLKK